MKLETYITAKSIQGQISRLDREIRTLKAKSEMIFPVEREIGTICLTTDELKILIEKRELALIKLQKEFDEL